MTLNDPADIARILATARTIAVVGLSSDDDRPSYGVALYLQRNGYRIIPVNPNESSVLGEVAYPDLTSVPEPIDLVNIFRRPGEVMAHIEEAIAVKAPAVWLQVGVVNHRAVNKALAAGLVTIQDRCIAVEHRRWRAKQSNSV